MCWKWHQFRIDPCFQIGKIIQQAAGKSNLKRVSLEMGGKSPNIIFSDCDCKYCITDMFLYTNQHYTNHLQLLLN